MTEEWRVIPFCSEMYDVSNLGRVRSWAKNRWGKAKEYKIISPSNNSAGYLFVHIRNENRETRKHYVHRLVASAFLGDSSMEVNHINGERSDNRLSNLEYVSHSENVRHSVYILGNSRGEKVATSKLTKDDVLAIINRLAAHEKQSSIARDYNVLQSTISDIATGRGWKWLTKGAVSYRD